MSARVASRRRHAARWIPWIAAAMAALQVVDHVVGEERSAAGFGGALEVTVVNLDVTVRDRDGRPVTGLEAGDFRVFEDGIEVPISNFAAIDGNLADAPPAAAAEGPPPTRRPVWVVLHVDNEHILPMSRKRVLRGVRSFVENFMTEGVRVAVSSSRRSLRLRQPFTDDPNEVLSALEQVARESSGRLPRHRQRRMIMERMEDFAVDRGGLRLENVRTFDERVVRIQIREQILAFAEEESDALTDALAALHGVVGLLAGRDGRRAVIYVSGGLPITPALDLMTEYAEVFADPTIFTLLGDQQSTRELRRLATAANGHHVRLYAIDATGLTAAEGFSAADRVVPRARASWTGQADHQHSLEYIADATGGFAARNTNDPSDGLSRIVADMSFVYSLGYQTPARSADEVRRLHVSLPEHPELEVSSRRWVVHKSADTRFRERVRSALLRPPRDNPLDLRVRAGVPSSTDGGLWEVPIVVSVPVRHLTLAQESDHLVGRVEVLLGLRDDRGRESPLRRVEMDLRLPASAAGVSAGDRYSVRVTVRCRERRQQVVVGLRNPVSGRASVARTEIAPP